MDRFEFPIAATARRVGLGLVALVAFVVLAAPAGAQSSLDVDVRAIDDGATERLRVTVAGLDDYEGGTLAVYLCGNADATGRSVTPDAGDCIARGADGYLTRAIDGDELTLRYELRREGIGADAARCVPALDGASPCQLVVAAVTDADADIIGVPLDDALAALNDGAANPGTPGSLPVTGVGTTATAVLGIAALVAMYLGHLLRSATVPARP